VRSDFASVTCLEAGTDPKLLEEFKLNAAAKNTVIVYRNKTVTARFANVSPNDFDAVAEAAKTAAK
jgi:hypothetical protein